MSKTAGASSAAGLPRRPIHRVQGTNAEVSRIGEAIFLLDLTIHQWAEQLNRAQPHRNGRLVVRFGKNSPVWIAGEARYDVEPIVGKMVLMQSGSWTFFKLSERDRYERLSDLRVGQGLKSDPLVVKIIDGIEDMLKQREALSASLITLRLMHNEVTRIMASCERRGEYAVDLADRVKIDWTLGAARAEEMLLQQRRDRYQRSKAAKAANSSEVSA